MEKAPETTVEVLIELFAPAVLLTLKQVAQVTGQAEQTLRNLISEGRTTLPSRKVGGKRVVHVLDLAEWLEEQRVPHQREVELEPSRRRPGRPTKSEQHRRQWSRGG